MERVNPEPPVVTIPGNNNSDPWIPYHFVTEHPVESIGPPPQGTCLDRRPWSKQYNGADADTTVTTFRVEGNHKRLVIIEGLRVNVLERHPIPKGTTVSCQTGGADGSIRHIKIDLDKKPPTVQYFKDPHSDDPSPRPWDFRLPRGEVETLVLNAEAKRGLYIWTAEVDILVAGKPRTITIDDGGKPFRTASSERSIRVNWDDEQGRWA
jgi:hypothetical protein